jgi:hypothetical protein
MDGGDWTSPHGRAARPGRHRTTPRASCGGLRVPTRARPDGRHPRRRHQALDAGFDAIARAAERLARERMAAWIESFRIALERDLIDAADF